MFPLSHPIHSLVAATHTPFASNSDVNLDAIESQANHLLKNSIDFAFVCGTTGECHSLTVPERMEVANRWLDIARGTRLKIIVHVGANCLRDCQSLASHAQAHGAIATASLSPSYFRPPNLETLVDSMAGIAQAANKIPFYFYDIPSLTNVQMSMTSFLDMAESKIPNLVGLKFTNSDLVSYAQLLQHRGGQWDVPFGFDELLLPAKSLGAKGAVGSTYNFAAPIYQRLISAFERGDLSKARMEQLRSIEMIKSLVAFGFMGAAKSVMQFLGVDVGSPRLPNLSLNESARTQLRQQLEAIGFFEWV